MRRLLALCTCTVIAALGLVPAGGITVDVDASRPLGPLPHFFRSTGFTPSSKLLTEHGRLNMLLAGGGGFRYMRVHCMLDLVDISTATGAVSYNWTALDSAFDAILDAGLTPFVNLNGNPTGALHELFLKSDFARRGAKLLAWRDLIEALGSHLGARYGAAATRTWRFEHWNEPMEIDRFCADGKAQVPFGSYENMFNYYDACVDGLGRADEQLQIGGPTTHSSVAALADDDPVIKFLEHCDSGTNAFSNMSNGTRLDFISIHRKGTDRGAPGGSNSSNILAKEREFFELIRTKHPRFLDLPFYNDEADPLSGWAKTPPWRPTPQYAAYMVAVVAEHADAMAAGSDTIDGVHYGLASNDNSFDGGWFERTLIATLNNSAAAGDQFAYDVVKKPDLTVMQLLVRLGSQRLHVRLGAISNASANVGAIATAGVAPGAPERGAERATASGSDGDGCLGLMLHRSDDTAPTERDGINVTVRFVTAAWRDAAPAAANESWAVAQWRLDAAHGNPYATWLAQGSPPWPSAEQMEALVEAQEPVLLGVDLRAASSAITVGALLPLPSVSLIQLCKQPPAAPAAPSKPTVLLQKQDGDATVVFWPPLDPVSAAVLKSYSVECSVGGAAFARANNADVIASAWVHRHRIDSDGGGGGTRCYRLRAIDLWGREGAPSSPRCVEGIIANSSRRRRSNSSSSTAAAAAQTAGLRNGAIWHDAEGNQIEAHGGTILKIGDVYHWYGASKKLPKDPATGLPCGFGCSMHVRLYTSTDLLNWSFVRTVFNASEITIDPDLKPYTPAPPFRIERPKVRVKSLLFVPSRVLF